MTEAGRLAFADALETGSHYFGRFRSTVDSFLAWLDLSDSTGLSFWPKFVWFALILQIAGWALVWILLA